MTREELVEYYRNKLKNGEKLHGEALELIIDADLETLEREKEILEKKRKSRRVVFLIVAAVLTLIAFCILVVIGSRDVPKEEIVTTTTTSTTVTTTTETTTESTTEPTTEQVTTATERYLPSPRLIGEGDYVAPEYFKTIGVISDGQYDYTWYSENVKPGGGLDIPGRHSDGNYVRDEDGYIALASSELAKGTILETPFGMGKVYDDGCGPGIIDVYVSW